MYKCRSLNVVQMHTYSSLDALFYISGKKFATTCVEVTEEHTRKKALAAAARDHANGMSIRRAAAENQVPYRTLARYVPIDSVCQQ